MKKNILLVFIILQSLSIFAQKAVAPHSAITKFYNTTTCIVFDSDIFNTYNSAIEKAVKQSWNITPYKFISMDEFKTMMHNPKYSFLVRTKVVPENNKTGVAYTFLSLVLGQRDKNFDELTEICSFPLSYYNTNYDEYDYKMGALLLFIENHIKITYNNPNLNTKNILRYYNNNIHKIGSKTLYFTKDDLAQEVNTLSKIKKYYKGNVRIAEPEEIQKHINDKDTDAIILHLVAPPDGNSKLGKCYIMLVGAGDGLLYYYKSRNISTKNPAKFLKQDFAKLNKK